MAPPKLAMRNQAVQAVGEKYFQVALVGLATAGVLAIVAVSIGSTRGMFEFTIDRCDCLLTSGVEDAVVQGAECVPGQDYMGVDIGWKSFVIDKAYSTEGCLDGWEGTKDIGSPFGDGIYRKKSAVYGNGATGAADASVGLFVVSAFIAIIMFKTVKMSYTGPGSIYSIGLHNIAVMCLLLSVASGISIAAFWGRIQGKLGDMESSLAATLFMATLDVCEDDWDTVGIPVGEGESEEIFCQAKPWNFEVPLYAGWTAIAHVAVMFLTSVWILSKSGLVEGILDGSKLVGGKAVTPRVVEYEQAVGRALATTEDPDYDVSDNKLYTGEANIMIRPYPLPGSVKKVAKAAEALVSPLRKMGGSPKHTKDNTLRTGESAGVRPKIALGGDIEGQATGGHNLSSPGPVQSIPRATAAPGSKAATKAAKKAAKNAAKKAAKKGALPGKPGGGGGRSASASEEEEEVSPAIRSSSPWDRDGEESGSYGDVETDSSLGSVARSPASVVSGKGHEKTRSEIDWGRIMNAGDNDGTANQYDDGDEDDDSPHLSSGMLGDLDMMFHGPSVKDGLTLGAITEDPREDMVSEFTMTPKTRGSATHFEV